MKYHKIIMSLTTLLVASGMILPSVSANQITTSRQSTINPSNEAVFPRAYNDYETEEQALKFQEQQFAQTRRQYRYKSIARNARDLGGYQTSDGKYEIKPDRLIRSDNLYKMNHHGHRILHHLRVNRIIDLRDNSQIEQRPDPNEHVYGIKYHNKHHIHLDVPITKDAIYNSEEYKHTQQDTNTFGGSYRYDTILSTSPMAKRGYRRALNTILQNKHGAVMYHCIAGRDRTGVLTAILLSALNVNRQTIYKDYLLTNYYVPHHSYVSQYNQLYAFFNTIDHQYGSMTNYLHKLGLNNHKIHKLRAMYLEPVK